MTSRIRLAIVVSHPIQHFVPFYRALAGRAEVNLRVFFASKIGLQEYVDREMNTAIAWKMDLLGGYDHVFLPEADNIREPRPLDINNPSISRELARFDPDVVLLYGYNQPTQLRALWWCRRNGVPAMMTGDSELRRRRPLLRRVLKRCALPLLLRQYTCFLTTGDNNEEYYRHYGVAHDRLFRCPLTIDEEAYAAARNERTEIRSAFRQAHGLHPDDFVVLLVGKLSQRKRPRDLVEAAQLLQTMVAPSSRSLRFLVAGNGPLLQYLKAMVVACDLPVRFLGFINLDVLPRTYCAADVLVHPSESDPHPLVLSEASFLGLPLIVSDRVGAIGAADIAQPGENALVYSCGDIEALAGAIRRLAEEPETRARMAAASLRISEDHDGRKSVEGALAAARYCLDTTRRTRLASRTAPDGVSASRRQG